MTAFIVVLALGAMVGVALVLAGISRTKSRAVQLLYEQLDALGEGPAHAAKPASHHKSIEERLHFALAKAGWPLHVRGLVVLWVVLSMVVSPIYALTTREILLGPPLGFATMAFFLWAAMGIAATRRVRLVDQQLARVLLTIANLVTIGKSMPQAIESVAEDAPGPLGPELRQAVERYRAGAQMPDALAVTANRLFSEEFRYFVTAVEVSQRKGGNVVDMITQMVRDVHERMRMRQEMRSELAEVQISKYVVSAAPVVAFFMINIGSPQTAALLFHSAEGWLMFIAAVVLWGLGYGLTSWMVKRVQP